MTEAPDTRTKQEKKHDALRDILNNKPTPIAEMAAFKPYQQTLPPIQKGKRK